MPGCASSHTTGISLNWGWSPGLQTPCALGEPFWGPRCLSDGSLSPNLSDPPLSAVYTALTIIATLGATVQMKSGWGRLRSVQAPREQASLYTVTRT